MSSHGSSESPPGSPVNKAAPLVAKPNPKRTSRDELDDWEASLKQSDHGNAFAAQRGNKSQRPELPVASPQLGGRRRSLGKVTCGSCGSPLADSNDTCATCDVSDAPARCTKCKARLRLGARFCTQCGTTVASVDCPPTIHEPGNGAKPSPGDAKQGDAKERKTSGGWTKADGSAERLTATSPRRLVGAARDDATSPRRQLEPRAPSATTLNRNKAILLAAMEVHAQGLRDTPDDMGVLGDESGGPKVDTDEEGGAPVAEDAAKEGGVRAPAAVTPTSPAAVRPPPLPPKKGRPKLGATLALATAATTCSPDSSRPLTAAATALSPRSGLILSPRRRPSPDRDFWSSMSPEQLAEQLMLYHVQIYNDIGADDLVGRDADECPSLRVLQCHVRTLDQWTAHSILTSDRVGRTMQDAFSFFLKVLLVLLEECDLMGTDAIASGLTHPALSKCGLNQPDGWADLVGRFRRPVEERGMRDMAMSQGMACVPNVSLFMTQLREEPARSDALTKAFLAHQEIEPPFERNERIIVLIKSLPSFEESELFHLASQSMPPIPTSAGDIQSACKFVVRRQGPGSGVDRLRNGNIMLANNAFFFQRTDGAKGRRQEVDLLGCDVVPLVDTIGFEVRGTNLCLYGLDQDQVLTVELGSKQDALLWTTRLAETQTPEGDFAHVRVQVRSELKQGDVHWKPGLILLRGDRFSFRVGSKGMAQKLGLGRKKPLLHVDLGACELLPHFACTLPNSEGCTFALRARADCKYGLPPNTTLFVLTESIESAASWVSAMTRAQVTQFREPAPVEPLLSPRARVKQKRRSSRSPRVSEDKSGEAMPGIVLADGEVVRYSAECFGTPREGTSGTGDNGGGGGDDDGSLPSESQTETGQEGREGSVEQAETEAPALPVLTDNDFVPLLALCEQVLANTRALARVGQECEATPEEAEAAFQTVACTLVPDTKRLIMLARSLKDPCGHSSIAFQRSVLEITGTLVSCMATFVKAAKEATYNPMNFLSVETCNQHARGVEDVLARLSTALESWRADLLRSPAKVPVEVALGSASSALVELEAMAVAMRSDTDPSQACSAFAMELLNVIRCAKDLGWTTLASTLFHSARRLIALSRDNAAEALPGSHDAVEAATDATAGAALMMSTSPTSPRPAEYTFWTALSQTLMQMEDFLQHLREHQVASGVLPPVLSGVEDLVLDSVPSIVTKVAFDGASVQSPPLARRLAPTAASLLSTMSHLLQSTLGSAWNDLPGSNQDRLLEGLQHMLLSASESSSRSGSPRLSPRLSPPIQPHPRLLALSPTLSRGADAGRLTRQRGRAGTVRAQQDKHVENTFYKALQDADDWVTRSLHYRLWVPSVSHTTDGASPVATGSGGSLDISRPMGLLDRLARAAAMSIIRVNMAATEPSHGSSYAGQLHCLQHEVATVQRMCGQQAELAAAADVLSVLRADMPHLDAALNADSEQLMQGQVDVYLAWAAFEHEVSGVVTQLRHHVFDHSCTLRSFVVQLLCELKRADWRKSLPLQAVLHVLALCQAVLDTMQALLDSVETLRKIVLDPIGKEAREERDPAAFSNMLDADSRRALQFLRRVTEASEDVNVWDNDDPAHGAIFEHESVPVQGLERTSKARPLRKIRDRLNASAMDTADAVDSKDDSGTVATNVIRAATLNRLVVELTAHKNWSFDFMKTFILTFHSFTTPWKLFDKLRQRFDVPDSVSAKRKQQIKMRVVAVVKLWIETQFNTFDGVLIDRLQAFIDDTLPKDECVPARMTDMLRKLLLKATACRLTRTQTIFSVPPIDMQLPLLGTRGVMDYIMCLPARVVAEQMTLLDWDLFSTVDSSQLVGQAWAKPRLQHRAFSVLKLIKRTNMISYWIPTALLCLPALKDRITALTFFIRVAVQLRELNNFGSLMAMLAGLGQSSVQRLKHTWAGIESSVWKEHAALETLMHPSKSFSAYRAALKRVCGSCIPYIGVFLSDLTFVDEGNPARIGDMINFERLRLTQEGISELLLYQQLPLEFPVVQPLHSFLHHAPGLGENTLWALSQLREPRDVDVADVV